jgi:hypothetical protein
MGLTTLRPSMSRLARQCGILIISQPYRPPRPAMGIAFYIYTYIYQKLELTATFSRLVEIWIYVTLKLKSTPSNCFITIYARDRSDILKFHQNVTESRGSALGTATGYGLDEWGVGVEEFSLVHVLLWNEYWGVNRPGREADHSPPTCAEVKKTWIYTSTLTYVFMAQCLVKYRDNFIFVSECNLFNSRDNRTETVASQISPEVHYSQRAGTYGRIILRVRF